MLCLPLKSLVNNNTKKILPKTLLTMMPLVEDERGAWHITFDAALKSC